MADNRSDFDGDARALLLIEGDTEATSDETTTDPRAEDVAEVEGDLVISPAFDFGPGVDESLHRGCVDVGDGSEIEDDGAKDGLGGFLGGEVDDTIAWSGVVPGTVVELI